MSDNTPHILCIAHPNWTQTIHAALDPLGYMLHDADDTASARQRLSQLRPQVILLQMELPDSLSLCRELTQASIPNRPFLVALAADYEEEQVLAAFEAGAHDFRRYPLPDVLLRQFVIRLTRERLLTEEGRFMRRLNQALYAGAASLDTGEVFQNMLDVLGDALYAKSAFIARYDPEAQQAQILYQYAGKASAIPNDEDWRERTFDMSDYPISSAWVQDNAPSKIIHIHDYTFQGAEAAFFNQLQRDEILLQVPLPLEDTHHRYYMQLWRTSRADMFTPLEVELVLAVSHQVTAQLRNSRLYNDLKRSQIELQNYTRALEARNRELDAYGHTIAHRMKSPLNLIANLALLLADDEGDALSTEGHETLHTIEAYAHNMSAMIDQMLRLAATREADAPQELLDVDSLVHEVLRLQKPFITKHHITIEVPAPLPPARGHAAWVQEIFSNLTHNAIKYMPPDQPAPTVTVLAEPDGAMVRYIVRDNGAGLAPDEQALVFDMFYSGNPADRSSSGIGLAIVERLVSNMGGEAGVQSAPGAGASFWFTLPALPNH